MFLDRARSADTDGGTRTERWPGSAVLRTDTGRDVQASSGMRFPGGRLSPSRTSPGLAVRSRHSFRSTGRFDSNDKDFVALSQSHRKRGRDRRFGRRPVRGQKIVDRIPAVCEAIELECPLDRCKRHLDHTRVVSVVRPEDPAGLQETTSLLQLRSPCRRPIDVRFVLRLAGSDHAKGIRRNVDRIQKIAGIAITHLWRDFGGGAR